MLDGGAADLVLNNQLTVVIQHTRSSDDVLGLEAESKGCAQLVGLVTVGDQAELAAADVVAGVTGDV